MQIDLHTHTKHSDGVLSAIELIEHAKKTVQVLSITDHDTVSAYTELNGIDPGITLVPGIEFTAAYLKYDLHIVGLGIDVTNQHLIEAIQYNTTARLLRAKKIQQYLEDKFKVDLTLTDIKNPSQLHYAKLLVEKKLVSSLKEVFDKHLGNNIKELRINWLPLEEVIATIHQAGGVAILAHPFRYKLNFPDIKTILHDFVELKGDGAEANKKGAVAKQYKWLIQFLSEHNLYASVGSDFHDKSKIIGDISLPGKVTPIWYHAKLAKYLSN